MEIQQDILRKHMREAAVDQLITEYREKGYKIIKDYKINSFHADLYAEKGNEKIIFEIKSGIWTKDKTDEVRKSRNYFVHKLQAEFKLIFVTIPSYSGIKVEGIENILECLIAEHFIAKLESLSTYTMISDVVEIEYDMIYITPNHIEVKGSGELELIHQNDDDVRRGDNEGELMYYTFRFHITLDKDRKIADVLNLEIDLDNPH